MGDILQECIETAADPTEQKVTSKTSADPPAPQRDAIPVPWLSTHCLSKSLIIVSLISGGI